MSLFLILGSLTAFPVVEAGGLSSLARAARTAAKVAAKNAGENNVSNDKLSNLYDRFVAHDERGEYREGLVLSQEATKIAKDRYGQDSDKYAVYLSWEARFHRSVGDYAKAEPLYKRALEIDEKALGPDHPSVATGLNNLGGLYDTLGDYDKAEPLYKRALEINEKALGPDHPSTVLSRNNLNYFSQRHGLRTWTDIMGKFSREAHFVSLSDGVVEIQLATGEKKSIPFEKLSDADQEYATTTQKLLDEDAEPAEEDPFQ